MSALVSIITPTYNSEQFIAETIDSIVNQTYKNWELLLIDDCSNDNTLHIVSSYLKIHQNIKILKNESNLGAALSRNKGIQHAKGDYIAFLDADDVWLPHKIEMQLQFMQSENIEVCFSSYNLMDEQSKSLHKTVKALPVLSYAKLLKSNYVGNLTGIYNAKVLGKIQSPNLRKRQDWLLWLAAIKASGQPAKSIQEPLAFYRLRKGSMSSNKIKLLKYNYLVYRKGLGFSALQSVKSMFVFLYEHFFVKSKQLISTNAM